ncbi:hypothetical protein CON15_04960 [Bacillus cereus]|jgi:hypothetical protein|uniref:Minor capsid protein n=1 Tax=Bacillus phage Deep-Purple TaxID=1873341 RepID=A0A1Z1LZQ3_9CAUD|nr:MULTISPECIES: putative minor capsid protein [Bacilli]YP_009833662.1 head-tail adaptor [Bacillus phage Deep-Purple]MED1835406.1 putative minor capsid protein [Bacillus thuringiensis]ARW58272.1 minor capsid protein [Bacillus phage Deep-Purple]PDZ59377.1 hypothetical protein CON15_04960 [Bacillus cereus]PEE91369.1 hypothetical protein COM92_28965 [Bacillus cereus]PGN76086.1 hypothetical protein CN967_18445 [Bacillus cereus]
MTRPIKKKLLCHTVKYSAYKGVSSGWGGAEGTYKPAIDLKFVRVQEVSGVIQTAQGEALGSKTIMFMDAKHTPYDLMSVNLKSKVVFHGREFLVKDIKYMYDATLLHHLEVELE